MERKLAQPGFWMAVVLVLLVLGIQLALAVPLGIINIIYEEVMHLPPPQLERQPLVVGCINIVACGAAIALGLCLNRLPLRRAFPLGRIPALQVVGAAITILGVAILLSEADNVFRALLPPPQWIQSLLKDLFFAEGQLLSQLFLLVIVAPVTEELLFRGVILRGLLSRHRPAVAVMLTALLFAALHLNPWQFLSALFMGTALGWFYVRTGSVALCVVGHAMANGLCILAQALPLDIPGLTGTPDSTRAVFQPWWLDLLGFGVLLAGLWVFRKATPPTEMPEPPQPPIIPPGSANVAGRLQSDAGSSTNGLPGAGVPPRL